MLGVDIKTNGLISGLPMIARYKKYLINLKGTVSDILSDPPFKDARFTTIPFKALSDQLWINYAHL